MEVLARHRRLRRGHDAGHPGQRLCGPVGLGQEGRRWAVGESHVPDCRGPAGLDPGMGQLGGGGAAAQLPSFSLRPQRTTKKKKKVKRRRRDETGLHGQGGHGQGGMDKEAWKQPRRQDPDYLTDLTDRGWRGMEMCHGVGVSDGAGAGVGAVAGGSAVQCSTCSAAQLLGTGLGLGWTGLGWTGLGWTGQCGERGRQGRKRGAMAS